MTSAVPEIRRTSAVAPQDAVAQESVPAHKRAHVAILLIFALSPLCVAQGVRYKTSAAPFAYEGIASRCHYERIIPTSMPEVAAVWVNDSGKNYTGSPILGWLRSGQIYFRNRERHYLHHRRLWLWRFTEVQLNRLRIVAKFSK